MPTCRVMADSTGEPPALIERVRVLEAPACAAFHAQVEALRPQWFQRGRESFHTLGAALYLASNASSFLTCCALMMHLPSARGR